MSKEFHEGERWLNTMGREIEILAAEGSGVENVIAYRFVQAARLAVFLRHTAITEGWVKVKSA